MAFKSSSDKIIVRSNAGTSYIEEATLSSVGSTNKQDINVLPGSIVKESWDSTNGEIRVVNNDVADSKVPLLIAIENAEFGMDLDLPYVAADSTSAADFALAPRVQYKAVVPGDIVQVRFSGTTIAANAFLAAASGGSAGEMVNGTFKSVTGAGEGEVPLLKALRAATQTNAYDKGLVLARVL